MTSNSGTEGNETESLEARVSRIEDELAIARLLLSYGPAADAGLTALAASVWADDGSYDWDADATPLQGRAAMDRMLQGSNHQQLIAEGVAHIAGPPLIEVTRDEATAVNYSLILRREGERFYVWRVSAVRWELRRVADSWQVRRRTNRLLDERGDGSRLFADVMSRLRSADPAD